MFSASPNSSSPAIISSPNAQHGLGNFRFFVLFCRVLVLGDVDVFFVVNFDYSALDCRRWVVPSSIILITSLGIELILVDIVEKYELILIDIFVRCLLSLMCMYFRCYDLMLMYFRCYDLMLFLFLFLFFFCIMN